jgi:ribA/ribD-fused uncharacterized protein
MAEVIASFRDEYKFLSNFYEEPFDWRGIEFQSSEQAFAYAKTFFADNPEYWQKEVLESKGPKDAKNAGRMAKINITEWDKNRVKYMREIVHAKFAQPGTDLVGKLINTGSAMLVEGNTWGDKFWGRCLDKTSGKMVGYNKLGVILMEERGYWLYSDFGDKK